MAEFKNGMGIIIPNYNGASFITQTIQAALDAVEALKTECRIYVVDDGSRDKSVEVLNQVFSGHPEIEIIPRPSNGGFGAACTTGFAANEYSWVLYLNSDVLIQKDALQAFWEETLLPENQDVFAFTGSYVKENGEPEKGSLERGQLHFGLIRTRTTDRPEIRNQKHPHFFANGGFSLFRADIFRELGGFCPLFDPFYSEDVDLSLRAARKGYKLLYCPGPKGVHENSKTVKENFPNERVQIIHFRNRLLLVWLHLDSCGQWAAHSISMLLRLVGAVLTFNRIILQGFGQAISRFGQVHRERRKIDFSGKSLTAICEESQLWNK